MDTVSLFNRYGIVHGHSFNKEQFELMWPIKKGTSKKRQIFHLPDEDDQLKVQKITGKIESNGEISDILKGPRYPIKLDKISNTDLGTAVQAAVSKVARVFTARYLGSSFNFSRYNELPHNMKVVSSSGYNKVIQKLRHGPVVGVLFPLALYGLPVWEQLKIIKDFPDNMALSGPLDILQAACTYPEFILKGRHSYDALGVKWGNSSLVLAVNDDRAIVDYRYNVEATQYFSGVLVIE